jgi:hypothetical protein
MWNWLENHPINNGLDEPSLALNENEGWQYMGSFKQGNKVIHEFRHRNHPKTNSVITLNVIASTGLTDDQIQKEFKL